MTRMPSRVVGALLLAICGWCHAATTFTYDALGRLTQVVYTSGATIVYAYDALGNRTTRTVTGVPGIAVVSGSPQLAALNAAFDLPLQVKVTNGAGAGVAGASVTIVVPGSGASASCTAPALTNGAGLTQTACTANGVAGNYVVTASTPGIPGGVSFALTNYQGATGTTTTLAASANPAIFGDTITLSATVSGNAPTGTVNFLLGAVSIPGCAAQPLVNGVATCTIPSLAIGNSNISAIYSGDGLNSSGTSSLLAVLVVTAIGLPDSGQDKCYDNSGEDIAGAAAPSSIARDAGTHPRQDCRYGRDPEAAANALPKIGAGAKGRDYTKIANNGGALAAGTALGTGAADWSCTKDNITGLTWEVKTDTPADLRYRFHSYAWYSTDAATNGGNPGGVGTNTCNSTLPSGQCNTQAYVAAVNATALCGFTDWRMPTHRELLTLVLLDGLLPTIDTGYFPNTLADPFWTGTTYARFPDGAWDVDFASNYLNNSKTIAYRVRLVRGSPF